MEHRTIAAVVVIGLLASAGAGALLFTQDGPPRVALGEDADAADKVTLYQNGLAFVETHWTFNASQGQVVLELPVPSTTLVDSLQVTGEGIQVQQVRTTSGLSGPVQTGDQVVVHVEDRTYEGTLLSLDNGELVLSEDGRTTIVRLDKVEAIQVDGQNLTGENPVGSRVAFLVQTDGGAQTVRVTYLARGPSWTPSYQLDLDTGETVFFATLNGLHNWQNVSLELISGMPHLVAQPSFRGAPPALTAGADEAAEEDGFDVRVGESTPMGELHRYPLEGTINLTRGETVRLPVRTGEVDLTRHYHQVQTSTGFGFSQGETQRLDVLERYELENTFQEPLPPGIVRFYQNGTWVGEDMLGTVPAGETTNVTVARSMDVTATLRLTDLNSTSQRETRTYALEVENHKADRTVDLNVRLSFPSFRAELVDTSPEPTRTLGDTVVWDATLDPGETARFTLTFERFHKR